MTPTCPHQKGGAIALVWEMGRNQPRNPGFVTWILVYFVGTHSVGDKRLWILQVQMSDVLKQCQILRVNSKLFATVGTAQTED